MLTKLVYCLTCSESGLYIEQALMSVFSARYYNPEANIILIVDDITNSLLVGKRAQILDYISEKIVVDCPADFSPMLRSRFIKTQVRQYILGNFLFIDCDTIITRNISNIDNFPSSIEIGAVLDCHQPLSQLTDTITRKRVLEMVQTLGMNTVSFDNYFSSGVLWVRDSKVTHAFYAQWHKNWLDSVQQGISIDQPSLAKTNWELNGVIDIIDNRWNCIMYEFPTFVEQAYIIHYAALDNCSWLFSKRNLKKIQQEGLHNDFVKKMILNSTHSFFPYQRKQYCGWHFFRTLKQVAVDAANYGKEIDSTYSDLRINSRFGSIIQLLFQKECVWVAIFLWMMLIVIKRKYKAK